MCTISSTLSISRLGLALAIDLEQCQFNTNLFMLGGGWYGALGPIIASIFGLVTSQRQVAFYKWFKRTIVASVCSATLALVIFACSVISLTAGWISEPNDVRCSVFQELWVAETAVIWSEYTERSNLNEVVSVVQLMCFILAQALGKKYFYTCCCQNEELQTENLNYHAT